MRFILWLLLWPVAAAAGQNLLMSTEELAAAQAQRPLALIDAENAESYQRAHIPGALNLY
ncbi:MAG TPA: rhodanese-like domain-containing protein [Thiobacillus sp.]|nr:rhodanese-like domain-containing protein [Thiobacillus sp.]